MTSAPDHPRRCPQVSVHGRARPGDRAPLAGPVGRRRHVRDAEPAGPAGRSRRRSPAGQKLFVLDMFPYPSGTGLHVGHPLGFIGTDVYARYKRMTGHNVMYTMGFDAFGLPAEQYAVQTGQHPAITTDANVANYRRQLRRLGPEPRHAPQRHHHRPGYYRWTQWIFLQIFNSWYDTEAGNGPADHRADRAVRVGTTRDRRRPRVGRSHRGRAQRRRSTSIAWPTSATRRSTGAPASAPSSPTRRSPPTVAATAATSRCSSATCASG